MPRKAISKVTPAPVIKDAAPPVSAKNNQPDPDGSIPVKPRRKKVQVTLANIEKFQQKKYCENIADLVNAAYPMLIEKIRDGNMKALEMGLQVANVLKPQNGISVVTQIYNKNQNAVTTAPSGDTPDGVRSFESIIRRLEAVDTMAAKPIVAATRNIKRE